MSSPGNPSKNGDQTADGRFAPGNALGRGRKEGSRNRATILLDGIADERAKAILDQVVLAAEGGDMRAAEIVLSRIWPPRKMRPVVIDLPTLKTPDDTLAALAAIVQATASGEMDLDSAQSLAGLVDVHRKGLELVDIDARLKRLEEAQAKR